MSGAVARFTVDPGRESGISGRWRVFRHPDVTKPAREITSALDDAEVLFRYATEVGIAVDNQIVDCRCDPARAGIG